MVEVAPADGMMCTRLFPVASCPKCTKTLADPSHCIAVLASHEEMERYLNVMKMKIMRWKAGITSLDRIRNEDIEKGAIAAIAEKLRETTLQWYSHVLRAENHNDCKKGLDLEVTRKLKRRPKQH